MNPESELLLGDDEMRKVISSFHIFVGCVKRRLRPRVLAHAHVHVHTGSRHRASVAFPRYCSRKLETRAVSVLGDARSTVGAQLGLLKGWSERERERVRTHFRAVRPKKRKTKTHANT